MKQAVSFGAMTDSSRWCREAMGKLYWRTSRADAKQHRMISNHIATTTTRPRLRLVRLARHGLLPRDTATLVRRLTSRRSRWSLWGRFKAVLMTRRVENAMTLDLEMRHSAMEYHGYACAHLSCHVRTVTKKPWKQRSAPLAMTLGRRWVPRGPVRPWQHSDRPAEP